MENINEIRPCGEQPQGDDVQVLLGDMETHAGQLIAQEQLLSQQQTTRLLDGMVRLMSDLREDILSLMSQQKAWRRAVTGLVAAELVRAAGGNLAVPLFAARARGEQTVYLFTGTHWTQLRTQQWLDFVKDAAQACGLQESEREDPQFMEALSAQVAFRVSRDRRQLLPPGQAWVNLGNGTLEISSDGRLNLRPHRREDWFTYCLPYDYDPQARCPRWHSFLAQMLPDPVTQLTLAQFVGYCFTRGIKAEKMLVLLGQGMNGKSVVLSIMEALLGAENVSNVSLGALTEDDEKRSLFEGKLLNISLESDRSVDTAMLKLLVSGEPVTVRQLYVGTHVTTDYGRLACSYNTLPQAEATHGFFRRWLILPFGVTVQPGEADLSLTDKLKTELSGIFSAWVLPALTRFLADRRFAESDESRRALDHYRLMSNTVQLFLSERCLKDDTFQTDGTALYNAYKRYCGEDMLRPLGKQRFYDALEASGCVRTKYRGYILFNIRMQNEKE